MHFNDATDFPRIYIFIKLADVCLRAHINSGIFINWTATEKSPLSHFLTNEKWLGARNEHGLGHIYIVPFNW